jgi:aryl-alcohol dehydrogenase
VSSESLIRFARAEAEFSNSHQTIVSLLTVMLRRLLQQRLPTARQLSCGSSCSHIPIRAAVCRDTSKPLSMENLMLEQPRADEVLIRMVATGICHTDMAVKHKHIPSPFPIVLGHEGAGVVEAVGADVKAIVPGDHVIMSYASCGECRNCLSGKPSYCVQHRACNFSGARLDGSTSHSVAQSGEAVHGSFFRQSSFATHALASHRNVLVVDKSLPLATLAPLGCGVQTGAGAILNTFQV